MRSSVRLYRRFVLPAAIQRSVYLLDKVNWRTQCEHNYGRSPGNMLSYAILFLIIALIAAFFGFGGIAGTAAWIAQVLFVIFLILFIVSLVFGRRPPMS
jgi:uncharacterized membrane protein YtjA (UPF0391 family)